MNDFLKGVFIELPLGMLSDYTWDWNGLCNELGINPWAMNEGLARSDDMQAISIAQAIRYGILPSFGGIQRGDPK